MAGVLARKNPSSINGITAHYHHTALLIPRLNTYVYQKQFHLQSLAAFAIPTRHVLLAETLFSHLCYGWFHGFPSLVELHNSIWLLSVLSRPPFL